MTKSYKANLVINVLAIIIALLFIANFIRLANSSGFLTFESFIQQCSTFSQFPLTNFIDLRIVADWGFFNFFRDFLNIFSVLLSVSLYLGANIMNSLWFTIQFVSIFIVA